MVAGVLHSNGRLIGFDPIGEWVLESAVAAARQPLRGVVRGQCVTHPLMVGVGTGYAHALRHR